MCWVVADRLLGFFLLDFWWDACVGIILNFSKSSHDNQSYNRLISSTATKPNMTKVKEFGLVMLFAEVTELHLEEMT